MEAKGTSQTALITGASTGIGYALARVFAAAGFNLVLTARDEAKLRQVATECQTLGPIQTRIIVKDLSLPNAAREIYDELTAAGVQVDVLVNNAGFGTHGRFWKTDLASQLAMIQVNVSALVHLTGLFLPGMIERGHGKILNVASTAAFQPGPLMAIYYASKAFVLSFSEAIDSEAHNKGVRVTALCPGPTQSEFVQRAKIEGTRLFRSKPMSADRVAQAGYRGLMNGKRIVIPGVMNKLTAFANRFVPRRLATWVAKQLNVAH